jgi:GNAT superfamily N-acetyltransferase
MRPIRLSTTDTPPPDAVALISSGLDHFNIDLVYLPANLRGVGLGADLLQMAEDEARQRGCKAGVLYTISFQAPGFYEKFGWQRFGEIPCNPPGASRVFMTKTL